MINAPVEETQPSNMDRAKVFYQSARKMLSEAWAERSDLSIGLLLIAAVWVIYMIVVPVTTWVFIKLWELENTMWNNMGGTIFAAVTFVVLMWRYFRKPTPAKDK